MSKVSNQIATPEALISGVLADLQNGRFAEASTHFAQEFTFTDHGLGLEFKDKPRLAEFFAGVRKFYPDSSLTANRIFISGDHVVLEWTYRATITEPLFGSASREIPISLKGASVVRTHEGEIADWADYYDGRTSRRTALAAHFKEWVEL